VAGAIVGGRSFTDGAETDNVSPLIFDGSPRFPPSADDGSIVIDLSTYFGPCPAPGFPRPDQVEIIVVSNGCEQRIMIEINDDTAQFIDGEFSDYALELTDPILVAPCEDLP
jgi:hypothetical protein